LTTRPVKKSCYVVIAGDRGLAGGYNSNVFKTVMADIQGKDVCVLPVGKKAVDYFQAHQIPTLNTRYAQAEDMSLGDCFTVAKQLCKRYLSGEFDEICFAYTNFVSVLSQIPAVLQMLPLQRQETGREGAKTSDILYEPDSETVFSTIIPEYLGGVLYGALCESRAAEQAARLTAMDSATSNAEEMIGNLSLQFNRARQAAITQEITEIVAGS
jgi:F-type H+-transporting ATPase subunit gamma